MIKQCWQLGLVLAIASSAGALEPPTAQQLERYRQDRTLEQRSSAARRFGNHRIGAHLLPQRPDKTTASTGPSKRLMAQGTQRVLTLLIDFPDNPGSGDPAVINEQLFGDGVQQDYPYESLRNYYQRASYGALEIAGSTLGWYTTAYPRDEVAETTAGREQLIREVIESFASEGHDFSQYDNDDDGYIDYFIVVWAGPHQEWAEFWWGYQTTYENSSFVVDGKRLGAYSWQWESYDYPGTFSANVVIHETGHALGLPDYYDYDDASGPGGGVGGLDMMDGNWGDHCAFSKYLLGWLTPEVVNQGDHSLTLTSSAETASAALLMHGAPRLDPFGEYFLVQFRRRVGNDSQYPTNGLLIWHVDARLSANGHFLSDNSYTDHKLLRLMEADGLEEIEQGSPADSGDFFLAGGVFGPATRPDSSRYDGAPTNLEVNNITAGRQSMGLEVSLGSGCALYCEGSLDESVWPHTTFDVTGVVASANCQGEAATTWQLGGADIPASGGFTYSLGLPGSDEWRFTAGLGDASCAATGSVLVCTDERCWQWLSQPPLQVARMMHALIPLEGDRVLAAGGSTNAEVLDLRTGAWRLIGDSGGATFTARGAQLDNGQVLVVGSSFGGGGNAALFDPVSEHWSGTGQMAKHRVYHSLLKLSDGSVLVAGGWFQDQSGDLDEPLEIELYDPSTETWSIAGLLEEGVYFPGLAELPDNRVLLTTTSAAYLFDPSSGVLELESELEESRPYHCLAPLLDGRLLLLGGDTTLARIFDPSTLTWEDAGRLRERRYLPTVAVLASGCVLVSGGVDASSLIRRTVELFDPSSGEWYQVDPMSEPRLGHAVLALTNGDALITGGGIRYGDAGYALTDSVERWTPPAPLRRTTIRRRGSD